MRKLSIDFLIEQEKNLVIGISTEVMQKDAKIWVEDELGNTYCAKFLDQSFHFAKWEAIVPFINGQSYIVNGCDDKNFVRNGKIVKDQGEWVHTRELVDYSDIKIISISVTDLCNMNCNMCWKAKHKKNNMCSMSFEVFQNILAQISFLAPAKVFLWGGEPLLNPNLFKMIRQLKKKHFMCYLVTNGLLLSDFIDELIDCGLDYICVSLDGIDEIQDEIRGVAGSFKKIENGILLLNEKKKLRPLLSTNTVINPLNYRMLYQIAEKFNTYNLNSMQFQYPVSYKHELGHKSKEILLEKLSITFDSWEGFANNENEINVKLLDIQLNQIHKDYPKCYVYPNITTDEWFNEGNRGLCKNRCLVPWNRINIEPNGDMTLCPDYSDMIVGNLLVTPLENLWNGRKYQKFRRLINENGLPICASCTYSFL